MTADEYEAEARMLLRAYSRLPFESGFFSVTLVGNFIIEQVVQLTDTAKKLRGETP